MMWRGLALLALLVIGGIGVFLLSPPGREVLDRVRINADRHAHWARFEKGLPLPGTPDPAQLDARLKAKGVALGDPVFLRLFKLESKVELWMASPAHGGRYVRVATYPICFWSGRLGPKLATGDLQAPEGYYMIDKSRLNPNSHWSRAFNLGYPNAFDAAHRRTGSLLEIHGGCASVGCYAMTNAVIGELWKVVTEALKAGQPRVPVLALPFRMTARNFVLRKDERWGPFWAELKAGSDLFNKTHLPPVASVCDGRYVFRAGQANVPVPPLAQSCPGPVAENR